MKITKITPYLISAPAPFNCRLRMTAAARCETGSICLCRWTLTRGDWLGRGDLHSGSGEPGCGLADFAGVGAAGGR